MDGYDPRYLAGILFFNRGDFFEAHEVWEDLWAESFGLERKFFQGMIQAAVGLCHFGNGNLGGALKLYRSSRDYLLPCGSPFHGIDLARFLGQMEICHRGLLGNQPPDRAVRPRNEDLPILQLDPAPAEWPNPESFLPPEA